MANKLSIKPYLTSADTLSACAPDDTIGSALIPNRSTHTPILVMKESQVTGILSTHEVLYKSKLPADAKVSSAAITPPEITPQAPLYRVAELMLATRLYILPVFDHNHQLQGIINIKQAINEVLKRPQISRQIAQNIRINPPITQPATATVRQVYALLKDRHISRVILVNDTGQLDSIVARSDIKQAFMRPTPKQRFSKGKDPYKKTYAFDEEKMYREDSPVRLYHTKKVLTAADDASLEKIIKRLLTSRHNSIVLIDENKKPTGFVSIRDIIAAVAKLKPRAAAKVIFNKPSKLAPYEETQINDLLQKLGDKLRKQTAVEYIELSDNETRSAAHRITNHKLTLQVKLRNGEHLVAKADHRILMNAVREAISRIEKQHRRVHDWTDEKNPVR